MYILEFIYIFTGFDLWIYLNCIGAVTPRRFQNKWLDVPFFLLAWIVVVCINSCQLAFLNLVGVSTVFWVTSRIIYKGKSRVLLVYGIFFYMILASLEMVLGIAYAALVDSGLEFAPTPSYSFVTSPFMVIVTKLLSYVCVILIKYFMMERGILKHSYLVKKVFMLPAVTIILLVGIQFSFSGVYKPMIIGCMLLVLANVVVFSSIEEMTEMQEQNKKYERLRTQDEMKEIYYEKMEEINEEHKKYAHNLKDYLQTIGGLAVKGNNEDILDILRGMETEVESIQDKHYTGNNILNALLCEKELIAEKRGIAFQIEPRPDLSLEFVKNHDLIVMIGNLLDNAIEAAGQCMKDKKIHMGFSCEQENFITIQIENTYNGVCRKEENHFLTTKTDQRNHGYGMKSVEAAAQKYGGMLFTEPGETEFTVVLTLSRRYYKE